MRAPAAPDVRLPLMYHRWRNLSFLHWRYPVAAVQPLLPDGLSVQSAAGSAWVGLIPLLMDRVRAPGGPAVPWLSRFPEINLRTYVRGPDGRPGIWFFSLEAARLPVVAAARTGYGLPYRWADMSLNRDGDRVRYTSRRLLPRDGTRCAATVEFGPDLPEGDLGPLDHFLTARYRLYAVLAGSLIAADAQHERWSLRAGRVSDLDQTLTDAAGLPRPEGEPLVHTSDGVPVRIAPWRPVLPITRCAARRRAEPVRVA